VPKHGGPQKDSNGTWSFVVDIGIDPATGKRRQARRRGFATKRAAQEELDRLRVVAHDRLYVAPSKQTVAEYLQMWLAALPASGLRPSTVDGYRRNLEGYIIPRLGHIKVGALTAPQLDVVYAELLERGRRRDGTGLSKRSVRYVHTTLHKALNDGVRKGVLARNVAAAAGAPSPKSTRAPEMKWWTPEQLRVFLAFTADEAVGPIFHLAAMTGMRRGEVCGLRWADVDFDAARLEVRHQLLVIAHQLVFAERTKTDHGRRSVDLDEGTVVVLRAQRARQVAAKLLAGPGWTESDLVFTQPDGSPVDPTAIVKVFDRRVARVAVPRIRFHDLRHTHVAHLIAAGELPLLIARRLGHASAAFTQDRYGHLFENAGSDAATRVAAMVFGDHI
jgi:integrase